jgi:hypothetical protein
MSNSASFAMLDDFAAPMQSSAQVQAVYQRPVKEVENVFGQRNRTDYTADVANDLRPKSYGPRFSQPYSEQLPHAGQGVRWSTGQLIPEPTRTTRVAMNKAFEDTPYYERKWEPVEHLPVLPTIGNIDADPRYHSLSTKTNMTEYKQICEEPQRGAFPNFKTVQPSFGMQ